MKPWRAAETSATASGKSTRIPSRSAIACSSGEPSTCICLSAAPVSSTAVFSVSVANCSRCDSCIASVCRSANSRSPRIKSSGSPPMGKPNPPSITSFRCSVRVMYAPMSFTEELNAHIGNEYAASQQYVAIAVYYDQETLPGLAAHFYRQAVEERNHAHMIIQYLLDADQPVTVPAVPEPQTTFADAVAPVQLALEQETQVTAQISSLASLARQEEELVGAQFLDWFLKEQREEVASMSDLLAIVTRAAESNLLLAEDYLSRASIGDAGDDPSAPATAGGAL